MKTKIKGRHFASQPPQTKEESFPVRVDVGQGK
jgi:hypothetical protein